MHFGFKLKYILPALILLFSCHAEKGKDRNEKFVKTYGEILFLTEKFKNDTLKLKEKIDSVLNANQMTMKQVDSFVYVYNKDPKKWAEFFDDVKKYLEDKKLNVQAKKH